jgi:hypothetical protein
MDIGDIPPPLSWLGVEGPRGPFCMPLRTSSKPIVRSYRLMPRWLKNIPAVHDGYKAERA